MVSAGGVRHVSSMPAMATTPIATRRVSSLLAGLEPSATLAVDARAKALSAAGEPVISFGAGEPNFPTPPAVVEAAQRACADPAMHKYTPTRRASPALREAICEVTARDSGLVLEPSQVLVTNGAKHAVYTALATLLDPGDEVLIPAPYWTTYPESVRLAGGVPVTVATTPEARHPRHGASLEASRTARTKLLDLQLARATRPARSTRRRTSRRSGAGRRRTTCGSLPTRSTSTSSTATPSSRPCPSSCPS